MRLWKSCDTVTQSARRTIEKRLHKMRYILLFFVQALTPITNFAGPLLLSTVPANSGGREPAPNVIVSIDNSGSMLSDIDTDLYAYDTSKRKMNVLKSSLSKTFGNGESNSGIIPDDRIRLAFQSMHDFAWASGGKYGVDTLLLGANNSIKPFSGTHRINFASFVNSLSSSGATPSHKMMRNVQSYLHSPQHVFSPWADNPGISQTTPYLGCRRTYHVFLTDGAWNSQRTTDRAPFGDGVPQHLPDRTYFAPNAVTSRAYSDPYGDTNTQASTLADFAFSNWARDFQDGNAGTTQTDASGTTVSGATQNMSNNVKPLIRKKESEIFTTSACIASGNCVSTPEYWNPKNNPATWQHITQYTIGFGLGAIKWPYDANSVADWALNNDSNDTFGGDFPKLVQGEVTWPDVKVEASGTPSIRISELWHMAINGRGKFYPARNADALDAAFKEILDTVIGNTSFPVVSIATNSNRLGTSTNTFLAGFKAYKYSGSLISRPMDSRTASILGSTNWSAAEALDARPAAQLANRFVFSYNGSAGILWKEFSKLPSLQQSALSKNNAGISDGEGQNRVNYIRGDRSKEVDNTGGIFRSRETRLGDIVNSNIWYLGKPSSGYSSPSYSTFRGVGTDGKGSRLPVVYVGANDGMLHGFAAESWPRISPSIQGGTEVLAYIPQGVAQGNLAELTHTNYSHRYYVDGSPATGDAEIGTIPSWTTVLIGTLGLGGKGYFLLDVSDPAKFSEENVGSLVIADTTANSDLDLGHITAPPVADDSYSTKSRQIVRMNDGRWAAVLGNGYNSTNEAPVLFIHYLDGDKSIKKVSPCKAPIATVECHYKGTNGLSSPQLIDLNGDGKVDVAYAGDLRGNVWKFNLASNQNDNWRVSFADDGSPNGRPFFVAKQGQQSFTTAPFWMVHPQGGVSIAIGTGRNLVDSDQSDESSIQTLYSLWDNSTYHSSGTAGLIIADGPPINLASESGIPASLVMQTISNSPMIYGGVNYFTHTSNRVDYSSKRGWYLNWAIGGQRSLQNIILFEGQKILVQTMIPQTSSSPSGETCNAPTSQRRSFLTIVNMFTGSPSITPVFPSDTTATASTRETGGDDVAVIRGINRAKIASANCPTGIVCNAVDLNMSQYTGARGNWQQLK